MRHPIHGFLFGLVGSFIILSAWPAQVEGAVAFFNRAPAVYYQPTYYQPYYRQPVRGYGQYGDSRVYNDPRRNANIINSQGGDSTPDYYQQYDNWWQK